jgi:hypothetical protein
MIEDILMVPIDTCNNPNCEKVLKEEEIMSGWEKSMNQYIVKCPHCSCKFVPRINIFTESSHNLLCGKEGTSVEFLSPAALFKEFMNCLNKKEEGILL